MRTRQEVSRQTAILSADTDCLDKHVEASRHVCLGRGFNSRRLHHFFKKSTARPLRGYPPTNDLRIYPFDDCVLSDLMAASVGG